MFLKGEKILDFSGPIVGRSLLPKYINRPEDDRFIQVGDDAFIGPSGSFDDLINHSCEPNAAVLIENKKAVLFSLRNISVGEEVTYDYSLQMYNEPWTMNCLCGAKSCRHIIKEYRYLPKRLKYYYLELGFVPAYNRGL
jgi:hypothetical protein